MRVIPKIDAKYLAAYFELRSNFAPRTSENKQRKRYVYYYLCLRISKGQYKFADSIRQYLHTKGIKTYIQEGDQHHPNFHLKVGMRGNNNIQEFILLIKPYLRIKSEIEKVDKFLAYMRTQGKAETDFTDEEKKLMIKMFNDGYNAATIRRTLKRDSTSVYHFLVKHYATTHPEQEGTEG